MTPGLRHNDPKYSCRIHPETDESEMFGGIGERDTGVNFTNICAQIVILIRVTVFGAITFTDKIMIQINDKICFDVVYSILISYLRASNANLASLHIKTKDKFLQLFIIISY